MRALVHMYHQRAMELSSMPPQRAPRLGSPFISHDQGHQSGDGTDEWTPSPGIAFDTAVETSPRVLRPRPAAPTSRRETTQLQDATTTAYEQEIIVANTPPQPTCAKCHRPIRKGADRIGAVSIVHPCSGKMGMVLHTKQVCKICITTELVSRCPVCRDVFTKPISLKELRIARTTNIIRAAPANINTHLTSRRHHPNRQASKAAPVGDYSTRPGLCRRE